MKRLILLRHSVRQDKNKTPESDCSITEEGISLAQSVGRELRARTGEQTVKIFCSPYRRTVETSFAIAGAFETKSFEVLPELAETLLVEFNNVDNISLPPSLSCYLTANGIPVPEPMANFTSRMQRFIDRMEQENVENVIAVTHRGPLERLASTIVDDWRHSYVGYCEYLIFEKSTKGPASAAWHLVC